MFIQLCKVIKWVKIFLTLNFKLNKDFGIMIHD